MQSKIINQTYCLQSDQGWFHMGAFDMFSPLVRRRLANSMFNLCSQCILDRAGFRCYGDETILKIIDEFELNILDQSEGKPCMPLMSL